MRTLKQLQPSCQAEAILEKVGKWQEIVNRQPSSTSEDNEKMTKRNYPYVSICALPAFSYQGIFCIVFKPNLKEPWTCSKIGKK